MAGREGRAGRAVPVVWSGSRMCGTAGAGLPCPWAEGITAPPPKTSSPCFPAPVPAPAWFSPVACVEANALAFSSAASLHLTILTCRSIGSSSSQLKSSFCRAPSTSSDIIFLARSRPFIMRLRRADEYWRIEWALRESGGVVRLVVGDEAVSGRESAGVGVDGRS